MAEFKFTGKYGQKGPGEIAVAAGTAEAQSDTVSINLDVTNMGHGEAIALIDAIRAEVLTAPWPPIA